MMRGQRFDAPDMRHADIQHAEAVGGGMLDNVALQRESVLRAVLYAVMELGKNVDGSEVLAHLTLNIPDYYSDMTRRELAVELAGYLAKRREALRPDEASAARVLRELVKNQRLG
jgi:hypothetical protein